MNISEVEEIFCECRGKKTKAKIEGTWLPTGSI